MPPLSSVPAVAVPTKAQSTLPQALFDQLCGLVKGPIYPTGHETFIERSKMFNGNVMTVAKALVRPLDAQDVSKLVVFCSQHGLSPSIKSGGYGTAGWAIGGDIIIDMSLIREIDIEPPQASQSRGYTGLRDMLVATSKGKGKVDVPPVQSVTATPATATTTTTTASSAADSGKANQKRRRDDGEGDGEEKAAYEARLKMYDTASPAVSSFLSGPPLVPDADAVLRELPKHDPEMRGRMLSEATHSGSRSAVDSTRFWNFGSTASGSGSGEPFHYAAATHLDPLFQSDGEREDELPPVQSVSASSSTTRSDPFGYLNSSSDLILPGNSSQPQSSFHPSYQPWSASLLSSSSMSMRSSSNLNLFSAFDVFNALPQVSNLEPLHPHVFVTFGAGMKQKEIDIFTASNPMGAAPMTLEGNEGLNFRASIPYHVPTAAHPCGSSIMLLGGFGFLSRLYGLSIDNLVEVEMVLADGKIVIANEGEHPDLWWALRGAGPCLGIATRYKAKAFPVPVVFAGNLLYRFHRATAPSLIRHFRDCVKQAPRELYANVFLTAGPADQDSLVVIQMCYIGPKEKGMEHLQAISSWDGERCLLNEVNEKSFLNQQDSVAQVLRGRAGRQWYIRSALITSLPDDIINQTVMQFADTPIGCTWLFELAGGAIGDFENTCLPKEQRQASFTIAALHQWELDVDDLRCVSSAEEWLQDTMRPVITGGPYPSFMGRHEPADRTKACYGNSWSRLVEIKRKYDPENLFRNTFWPLDKNGELVESHTHEPPSP